MVHHNGSCLSMLGTPDQALRGASTGTATIQIATTATIDAATRLYRQAAEAFLGRAIDQGTLPGLDPLRPEALAAKVRPRLLGMAKLRDPGLNWDEQEARLAVLQELAAGAATDVSREVTAHARCVVEGEFTFLHTAIKKAFGSAPNAVRELVVGLRTALDGMVVSEPDSRPLLHWLDRKKIADNLQQRRSDLPRRTLKITQDALAARGRVLFEQALEALALERIVAAWRPAVAESIALFDDLINQNAEMVETIQMVQRRLEDTRAAVAADQHVSRASVVKVVDGPTEDQCIAGMRSQLGVATETDLASILFERHEAALREACRQECPWIDHKKANLARLIHDTPLSVQVREFLALVERTKGSGQSLYEILERAGIADLVDFLYNRSLPLAHLSGRGMVQLGLAPFRRCIVILPRPVLPSDNDVHESIRLAFEEIDSTCSFAEAPSSERTVVAVQVLLAFPPGIESQCPNLLNHYLSCADQNHLPHLLLDEISADGKVLDAYKMVFNPPSQRKENDDVHSDS